MNWPTSDAAVEYTLYTPFGDTLLDTKTGTYENDHKYTNKELDTDTGLYYYGARYYNSHLGVFIAQDPVFVGLGSQDVKSVQKLIRDPQRTNSYSYSRNNPINLYDPDGRSFFPSILAFVNPVFAFGTDFMTNIAAGIASYYTQPVTAQQVMDSTSSVVMGSSAALEGAAMAGVSGLTRMRAVREMGAMGESMISNLGQKMRINSFTGSANYRIPDGVTSSAVNEVKNVSYLRLTNQLKDFMHYAEETGKSFNLYVRENTQLSSALQGVVDEGKAVLHRVLPSK